MTSKSRRSSLQAPYKQVKKAPTVQKRTKWYDSVKLARQNAQDVERSSADADCLPISKTLVYTVPHRGASVYGGGNTGRIPHAMPGCLYHAPNFRMHRIGLTSACLLVDLEVPFRDRLLMENFEIACRWRLANSKDSMCPFPELSPNPQEHMQGLC